MSLLSVIKIEIKEYIKNLNPELFLIISGITIA